MRLLIAFAAFLVIAAPAFAQDVFDRGTGGEITATTKAPAKTSGSLGLEVFAGGGSGYNATLGGTLLEDRIWFFGSLYRSERQHSFASAIPEMPAVASAQSIDAKLGAQLGSRQTLDAVFSSGHYEAVAPAPAAEPFAIPSSFLTLRYTGVVSSNMFFTATLSQSSTKSQPLR